MIRPPPPRIFGAGVAAFLILTLGACGRSADSSPAAATVVDSAGVEIVTSTDPSWGSGEEWRLGSAPTVEIGMAEGPNEYLFARVRAVRRLSDGSILVANAQSGELRIFDPEGRHLRTIGRRGEGPGEFGEIVWLTTLPGDSIVAYAYPERRLSLFAPTGEFVGSTTLDQAEGQLLPQVFGRFADGSIAATTTEFTPPPRDGGVIRFPQVHIRFSPDGALIDTLSRLPGRETHLEESTTSDGLRVVSMSVPLFGRSSVAAVVGDRGVFGSNDRYELQVVTPGGRLERLIRRDVEPRPVTEAMLEAAREARVAEARTPEDAEQRARSLRDDPYGATVPFYERLLGDDEGNLWLQGYPVPGEAPPGWAVFDPQGRLLGSVQLPESFSPMHIGADFVLGVVRDELGVERVRMYALEKPAKG